MLNEANKRAIVTEMAPQELATHLKLNADRYSTNASEMWQVVSHVNLKLPTQPTSMWIDHVEQGDDGDQEDWNVDYFGRTARGRARAKGKDRKAKEQTETETLATEDSKEHAIGVKRWNTEQANAASRQHISEAQTTTAFIRSDKTIARRVSI